MSYDLATAKVRLGIDPTDTSQDDAITAALNSALAVAEHYCDRAFYYKLQTDEFLEQRNRMMLLTRYPVEAVQTIKDVHNNSAVFGDYDVHQLSGVLIFPNKFYCRKLAVTYTGGYKVLPADLESALWYLFDSVWSADSGSAVVSSGTIDSITVQDVGTVRYSSQGGSSGGGLGVIPYTTLSMLDPYKAQRV